MSDVVIRVENLSKRYRLGQIGATTLRESAERWWHRFRGRDPAEHMGTVQRGAARCTVGDSGRDGADEIWAVKDVSFEVKRGDVLGIIGKNGAGKSTLLKILTRITEPTSGRAVMRGRVSSLLEVGTGFHPELTGRENVYLNGAILGMKRREIDRKFDEIISFAEIEKFVDTPVKRYSSGMYVRLAFAVAAHLEPEILLIDEVLAVGDAGFQRRCLGKMDSMARGGRTVLFVSHNMAAVRSLCGRGIWLDNGCIRGEGGVDGIVATYLKRDSQQLLERHWGDGRDAPGNDAVTLVYAGIDPDGSADRDYLTMKTSLDLVFRIINRSAGGAIHFNVLLYNQENICVFNTGSTPRIFAGGIVEGRCRVPPDLLNDGVYSVRILVFESGVAAVDVAQALSFELHDEDGREGDWYGKWTGIVRPALEWWTGPPGEDGLR